jgi:hypothetical protein
MNNYPDGMDFDAYDDYHDPKVECCGSRASDCECSECSNCSIVHPISSDWYEVKNIKNKEGEWWSPANSKEWPLMVCDGCHDEYIKFIEGVES